MNLCLDYIGSLLKILNKLNNLNLIYLNFLKVVKLCMCTDDYKKWPLLSVDLKTVEHASVFDFS